jgi:hypothetical protein
MGARLKMKTGQSRPRFFGLYSLLILPLLILVACQPAPDLNTAAFATAEISVIPTAAIAPISTERTVAQTTTTAPIATSIPSTATSVPSPVPTLSLAEKEAIASELYNTNANCKLPCWWGIVPGETEWQTAKLFLDTIATKIITNAESEFDPYYSTSVTVPVPEDLSEISLLEHTFIVEDGIIVEIKPEGPWGTRKVDIVSEILSTYGRPTEVWLDTLGENYGDNYFPFRVALFYPEQGLLVRYFDEAELTDGYVTGCPQEDSATFVLWSPKRNLTFLETLSRQQGVQYYKPLEEVTEMDIETFYQIYLDPDTEICIETPAELWIDR